MKIAGFQKHSLIDYPGKICAIIFTPGCNFRCPYCHNPGLVIPEKLNKIKYIPEEFVFSYLKQNKNFLDAVEITGGEPTIHKDLPMFIRKIKEMGYSVKLDTNGTNPSMLKFLIKNMLIDYVAMDIKTSLNFQKYNELVGNVLTPQQFENIKESIKILMNSEIDYEFRTTLIKGVHTKEDVLNICKTIRGARKYFLQEFNPEHVLKKKFHTFTSFNENEVNEIISGCKKIVENVSYR